MCPKVVREQRVNGLGVLGSDGGAGLEWEVKEKLLGHWY